MALSPTALSALIQSNWLADSRCGFSSPMTSEQRAMVAALADGVASAVVTHITTTGVVVVAGVLSGGSTAAGVIT